MGIWDARKPNPLHDPPPHLYQQPRRRCRGARQGQASHRRPPALLRQSGGSHSRAVGRPRHPCHRLVSGRHRLRARRAPSHRHRRLHSLVTTRQPARLHQETRRHALSQRHRVRVRSDAGRLRAKRRENSHHPRLHPELHHPAAMAFPATCRGKRAKAAGAPRLLSRCRIREPKGCG